MTEYDEEFHRKIAEISISCFEKLPKTGKPTVDQWTVLSAIVQETNCLEVVAMATGSKCLGRNQMSKTGEALNDSHAEILCRRAFLKYIYNCLETRNEIFQVEPRGFSLKENVKFHFFTSHIPCGDASIFPKNCDGDFGRALDQEPFDIGQICEEPKSKKPKIVGDICRTGAKCLPEGEQIDPLQPGDKYHVVGVVRTKPGRGDPTLSVSCSDKLAKWFHLGIQGALLSHLIPNPIYLQTVTICAETPFNLSAMTRALFDRIPTHHSNPPPAPKILQTNVKFAFAKTSQKKPCPSSMIYYKRFEEISNAKKVEVSVKGLRQGITKNTKREQSRLSVCKLELFKSFLKVVEISNGLSGSFGDGSYHYCKKQSVEYQRNWKVLKEKGFKIWTKDKANWEMFDKNGEEVSSSTDIDLGK